MKYKWKIEKRDIPSYHNNKKNYSPIIQNILKNRGFDTPQKINSFLYPSLAGITSPFLLKDINKAVERITTAIKNNEKILIFGDYDADGVTSTAILNIFLNNIGANVSWYIPHRVKEGYSLKKEQVESVIEPGGWELVITVDCGSDSFEAAKELSKKGIDLIITDHHTVGEKFPDAAAFVNPSRPDCESSLSHLAGVGVAFYLLIALRAHLRKINFFDKTKEPDLKKFCDIVALGTIGDIVPLIAENRAFTRTGLELMGKSPLPGISSLIKSSKINKNDLDSDDIAFRLAPRINAAGRMDNAGIALNLLLETNIKQSDKLAAELNKLNIERQNTESAILKEIIEYLDENPENLKKKSLVFARQGWNPGIIGIIASKLSHKYDRPVILIGLDGTTGKGSGRSIPAVNIYKALSYCKDNLTAFGGHKMAAGLSIDSSDIKAFSDKFEEYVVSNTKEEDFLKILKIDSQIEFDEIDDKLLNELELFQPFGAANEEPVFVADEVSVISSSDVGKTHKRVILAQLSKGSGKKIAGINFNHGENSAYPHYFKRLAFKLRWNKWNNSKSPQIFIEDYEL